MHQCLFLSKKVDHNSCIGMEDEKNQKNAQAFLLEPNFYK